MVAIIEEGGNGCKTVAFWRKVDKNARWLHLGEGEILRDYECDDLVVEYKIKRSREDNNWITNEPSAYYHV